MTKIPAALVEREAGERLAELARTPRGVRVRVTLDIDAREKATAHNVVARVPGRDSQAGAVVLGAHLDSWDLGQGAQDDGCNVALAIDVGREAMRLGRAGARPRRPIEIALFSGEELGLDGSRALARAERAHTAAMVVFDEGSDKASGYAASGWLPALRPLLARALEPVAKLGPFFHTDAVVDDMDSYSYHRAGIPTLSAIQAWAPYAVDYHAETDTFDKVDLAGLKANAVIAGATAWSLAEAATLPALRPAAPAGD